YDVFARCANSGGCGSRNLPAMKVGVARSHDGHRGLISKDTRAAKGAPRYGGSLKTRNRLTLLFAAFAFMVTGCGQNNSGTTTQEIAIDMDAVRSDLLTIAEARILLGHQSVG